jgi:DNA-binding transcriptional MerR regulator
MLKIGYFSRLSQVPVRTLHYSDQIGLFKPACVDAETGYRYYALAQLVELNHILALKDLGLSLQQIANITGGELSREELRGMLRLRQVELEESVTAIQSEMARLLVRLRQLDMEDEMSDYEVVLKTTQPMLVASQRVTIPTNDQVPSLLRPAFKEVHRYIQTQGAKVVGPSLVRWHTPPDVYVNEDVEAIFPVDRPIAETEAISVYELPVEEVAAVVHHGEFDEFTGGHQALLQWAEANEYRLNGAYREIYHATDEGEEATIGYNFLW